MGVFGHRRVKIRKEKRKREDDRLHKYPSWAKVLEDACKDELRVVLGDSIGNPELMRKRVEERVRQKGRDLPNPKPVLCLPSKSLSESLLGYLCRLFSHGMSVMERLGAFNSTNLQLPNSSMEYNPHYDVDKGFKLMSSSFHDINDVEFQNNWGRVWVDLGTADYFAVDVLLNCLTILSTEYLGIQQRVFGGRNMGDWEEGMIKTEYGHKYFKI